MNQSIIFLHIHKAGGTTLHDIILQNYKKSESFYTEASRFRKSTYDFINLDNNEKKQYKIIRGHMYFGIHKYLPQEATYISMLRDPVERLISNYFFYLKNNPQQRKKNFTLKDYILKSQELKREDIVNNLQTRLISGYDFHNKITPIGKTTREMLEQAKSNIINHFSVAGLTEYFDESLILFHKKLGWKNLFYKKQNVNINKVKKEISHDELELIKKYNNLDIELYNFAKKRFFQQMKNEIEPHKDITTIFQMGNITWQNQQNVILKKEKEIASQKKLIISIKNSLIWKATTPLRAVGKIFNLKNKGS